MIEWRFPKMAALAALLSLTGGAAEGAEAPDCRLRMIATLELRTLSDGRVTVPAQVEGHDYRLMVDTGGYINTLSPMVVKQEGYRPQPSQGYLRGMGNTVLRRYVDTKDFVLGRSHGKNFRFFVDDFSDISVDGTLAPEVLGAYDVDLDFAHDKLNLVWPDHCPGEVVYWTRQPVAVVPIQLQDRTHIRIPITLDGKEIMAILDTGAHTSFMTRRAARALGIEENTPGVQPRGIKRLNGMVTPILNYPFKALEFGGVKVSNPQISIISDQAWKSSDLLIGIGILRQMHVYIAYREKKLYLSPALAN